MGLVGLLSDREVQVTAEPIGRGAKHIVFRAICNKREAIAKTVIDLEGEDLFFAEKLFEQEYRVLSRLDHPGIVKGYGLWRSKSGRLHLIAERVPGVSLETVIQICRIKRDDHGARHWDEVSKEIVRQVGAALSYIHKRGVFHNDIKPDNMLVHLLPNGRIMVKLIDFDSTGDQNSQGKFEYAAPERIDTGKSSQRTDLYSLGVLIYRMLSGTHPFRQANRTESRQARETPIDQATDPVNQKAWNWICQWPEVADALKAALDANPKNRPSDVGAFMRRLNIEPPGTQVVAGYGIAALTALLVAGFFVLPLKDSTLSRKMTGRVTLVGCKKGIESQAEDICTKIAPGRKNDCVSGLTFTADPVECLLRRNQLTDCDVPASAVTVR